LPAVLRGGPALTPSPGPAPTGSGLACSPRVCHLLAEIGDARRFRRATRSSASPASTRSCSAELPRLHPSVMFNFTGVSRLLAWEAKRDRYERWRRPRRSRLGRVLPRTYVAVRFYSSRMFRGKQAERFARDLVRAVSARIPVVDLSTAFETDPQHPDLDVGDDVVRLAPHMRFRGNLRDQSVAIANASAFVGVFGGTAFLAPHYGVPSSCFWSTTKLVDPSSGKGPWANLRLAERAYNGPGWGGFEASSCIDADADEVAERIVRRVGCGHATAFVRRRG
jgi:hypothetical protein